MEMIETDFTKNIDDKEILFDDLDSFFEEEEEQ